MIGATTIKDVAQRCGVSRQAVSNALRGQGRLSSDTRQRIQATARELGYRPNSIARTMRTGRFGSVTLLLSTREHRNYIREQLLTGIHDALAAHDLHLSMTRLPDAQMLADGYMPKLLREWASDGLLINYISDIPSQLTDLIRRHRIPFMMINSRHASDSIHFDDEGAARQATEHLLRQGHRRICFVEYRHPVTAAQPHYSSLDRLQGYRRAMLAAGLEPRCFVPENGLPWEQAVAASKSWLAQADRPTAVVAYGDVETVALTQAAAGIGLELPRDMSLITFSWAGSVQRALNVTHMELPEYDMGRSVVELLCRKLELGERQMPTATVACQMSPDTSTAPPRL